MKDFLCRRVAVMFALVFVLRFAGCGTDSKSTDPTEAANAFFQLLSAGKMQEAYQSTAFTFQAGQSLQGFEQTARELGVMDYAAITWKNRNATEKDATLDGEVTTRSGGKVPVSVTLVREAGKWKLHALHTAGKGNPNAPTENPFTIVGKGAEANDIYTSRPMPSQAELVAMTREVLLRLNEAIKRKDFTEFYDSVSETWRKDVGLSLKRMERTYQPFIDAGVNMEGVATVDPVWTDPPQINSRGLLILNGQVPTQPNRVNFKLEFIYELPDWKLFGIDLALLKDEPASQQPSAAP